MALHNYCTDLPLVASGHQECSRPGQQADQVVDPHEEPHRPGTRGPRVDPAALFFIFIFRNGGHFRGYTGAGLHPRNEHAAAAVVVMARRRRRRRRRPCTCSSGHARAHLRREKGDGHLRVVQHILADLESEACDRAIVHPCVRPCVRASVRSCVRPSARPPRPACPPAGHGLLQCAASPNPTLVI